MRSNLLKGLSINLLGGLIPMVVTLVVTPIYLHLIGLERFGVLSLVWLLLGYLGVFDLGFGRAVARSVASVDDEVRRAEYLWIGFLLSALSGLAGAIFAFAGTKVFATQIFAANEPLRRELMDASIPLCAMLPLVTGSSVLSGYLQGREKFLKLNSSQSIATILLQGLPLIAASQGYNNLEALAISSLIARAIGILLLFFCCISVSNGLWKPVFKKSDILPMLSFGGSTMASGALNQILLTMDRFVIGAVSSVNAVAVYSIPYNIIIRATLIPYSWFAVLYPKYAAAKNDADAQQILAMGCRVMFLIITPVTACGIAVIKPFLNAWVGGQVAAESGSPGVLLMFAFWFYAMTFAPLAFFQARGRSSIPARLYMVEAAIFIPALYFGVRIAGINGAAIAWGARALFDGGALFYLAGQLRLYFRQLTLALPCLLPFLVVEFLNLPATNFLIFARVIGLIFVATYIYFLLTREEINSIRTFLIGRVLKKRGS